MNIELNVVALGDFTSVNDAIAKLRANVASLNASLAGATGASFDKATASVKSLSNEFSAALTNSGAFTKQTVQLQSETEKFGQSLQNGTLGLGNYYQILRKQQGAATDSVKALALEQTKLQNSVIMADPSKSGFYSVFTPKSIDAISNATKIAANEQNIYNIALRSGSTELINWGKNTQWAGRQLTVGMAVPLLVFGQQAVASFDSVNKALTQLQKVYGEGLTPPSQNSIDQISQQVLNLGKNMAQTLGISQEFTVQVATQFAAMGKQGNDLLTITEQTDRLAKLGNLDQTTATNAVIALQNVYKMNTTQLADAVNYFGAMQKQTSLSMSDLVQSESRIGPIIEELGGTYKDSAVMVLAMKEAGVPAAKSANALKAAMASIINPTSAATKEFASFGINLNNIKDQKGPVNMILALQQALEPLSKMQQEQLIDKLFGKYQFGNITALIQNLGKAGSQTVNALQVANASSSQLAGLANQEIAQVTKSPSAQWQIALQTFKADLYPVGQDIIKIGTKILDFANHILKAFNGLPGPLKLFVGLLLGLTVVAGPLIMLTGLMANFIGNIIKASVKINDLIRGGKSIKQLLTPEFIAAQNATGLFAEGLKGDVDEVQLLIRAITDLTEKIKIMQDQMGVGAGIDSLKAAVGATAQVETSIFEQMALPGFADGGIISGPGSGTSDSILARVSNGETILTAEQTRKNAGVIADIISGRHIPGYAEGNVKVTSAIEDFVGKNTSGLSPVGVSSNLAEPLQNWLRQWMTNTARTLESENPNMTAVQLRNALTNAYKNVTISANQIPEELQEFFTNIQSELALQLTPRELVQSSFRDMQHRLDFAHASEIDTITPKQMSSASAANDPSYKPWLETKWIEQHIADPKTKNDLNLLATTPELQNVNVGFKGSWGYDQAHRLNNRMQKNAPVPVSEFNEEFMSRGAERWSSSLKILGKKFEDLSQQSQDALTEYDNNIKKGLEQFAQSSRDGLIRQSDFDAIEREARKTLPANIKGLVDGLDNTITEIRLNTNDPAAIAKINELSEQGVWQSGKIKKDERLGLGSGTGTAANRKIRDINGAQIAGLGNFSADIDEQRELVRQSQEIHSPSGVWRREVGVPIAQGVGQGFNETISSVGSQMHEDLLNFIPGIKAIAPMTEEAAAEIGNAALDGITIPLKSVGSEIHSDLLAAVAQAQAASPALESTMAVIGQKSVAAYEDAYLPEMEDFNLQIIAMKQKAAIEAEAAAAKQGEQEALAYNKAKLEGITAGSAKIVEEEELANSKGLLSRIGGMKGGFGGGLGALLIGQMLGGSLGGTAGNIINDASNIYFASTALRSGLGKGKKIVRGLKNKVGSNAAVDEAAATAEESTAVEATTAAEAAGTAAAETTAATVGGDAVAGGLAAANAVGDETPLAPIIIGVTALYGGWKLVSHWMQEAKVHADTVHNQFKATTSEAQVFGDTMNTAVMHIKDIPANIQGITDKFGDLNPQTQKFVDYINSLSATDPTKLFVTQLSQQDDVNNITSSVTTKVSTAISTGGLDPKQAKDYVMGLLTAAGKAQDFNAVWASVSKSVTDLGSATEASLNGLNSLVKQTGASWTDYAENGDATAKSYKELNNEQKALSDQLFTLASQITSGTMSYSDMNTQMAALSKSGLNGADGINALGAAIQNSGDKSTIAAFDAIKAQLDETNSKTLDTTANLIALLTLQNMGVTNKTIDQWAAANPNDPNLKGTAQVDYVDPTKRSQNDTQVALAYFKSKQFQSLREQYNQVLGGGSNTGNGANGGAGGSFAGTTEEQNAKKSLQNKLDAQNAELKIAKDQLSVQQKIANEAKAQLQYQQQITGLQNDMKTAMISGNYLQAASLKQQISGAKVDFNASSVQQKMQDQVDSIQSNADLINQGLQDLKDAITSGVTSLSKMPASVAAAQSLGTINAQSLSAGIATGQGPTVTTIIQVTGSVTGTSTQSSHPGTKSSVQTTGTGVNSNGSKMMPSKVTVK